MMYPFAGPRAWSNCWLVTGRFIGSHSLGDTEQPNNSWNGSFSQPPYCPFLQQNQNIELIRKKKKRVTDNSTF